MHVFSSKFLKIGFALFARCLVGVIAGSAAAYGTYSAFYGRMENFHSTSALVCTSIVFLGAGYMAWSASLNLKNGLIASLATALIFNTVPWALVSGLLFWADFNANFPNF